MSLDRRLNLQKEFEEILGTKNVYFQPPPSIKLKFPCIVYNLSTLMKLSADNKTYKLHDRYQVTYITKDPDDTLIEDLMYKFELISFSRHFTSDNLNHYIYDLYY